MCDLNRLYSSLMIIPQIVESTKFKCSRTGLDIRKFSKFFHLLCFGISFHKRSEIKKLQLLNEM